ncbi:MarR family transcriptional regulator [Paenibacillus sp. N1-5-1-14]|uniref:MarR family winged helix-turn-helix transcriptional regulator n=1 Tax=Paenibacillus radicibacter TaxID=2972488 RepID=UPI0021598566|nr:MarR family transcriptional regulator [Paenibacillus radicibacter]MCR8644394.1 MarR family transcriptional regulator [Paenibacillus radicibacter]
MSPIDKQNIRQIYSMYSILVKRWMTDWNKSNELNIPHTHFMALEMLELEGPQRATELANALALTSGGVTVMADKLVKSEYVERVTQEGDRRVVRLRITEQGQEALRVLQDQRTQMMDNMFDALTEEEEQELTRIYAKLMRKLEQ